MGRDTRYLDQLHIAESELKKRLIIDLKKVVTGERKGMFDRSQMRPAPSLNPTDPPQIEELGEQIVRLRSRVGEALDKGIFANYINFCTRWEQEKSKSLLIDKKLAEEFLKSLGQ